MVHFVHSFRSLTLIQQHFIVLSIKVLNIFHIFISNFRISNSNVSYIHIQIYIVSYYHVEMEFIFRIDLVSYDFANQLLMPILFGFFIFEILDNQHMCKHIVLFVSFLVWLSINYCLMWYAFN